MKLCPSCRTAVLTSSPCLPSDRCPPLPFPPLQIIVGDVFSALGRNTFGPDSLLANRRVIIAAIGLGLLLPLCFIRRLGALAALSSIAVAGFLYTSGIVILTALKVCVFWCAGFYWRH